MHIVIIEPYTTYGKALFGCNFRAFRSLEHARIY